MIRYIQFLCVSLILLLCFVHTSNAIEPENIRFKQISVDQGLTHNNVNAIIQDTKGFIWLGTRSGLCSYDGYKIKRYTYSRNDTTSLTHNFITNLMCDNNQQLWICTEGGLCKYDSSLDNFKSYNISSSDDQRCKIIYQTKDGRIIVSTAEGLFQYNEPSDTFAPMDISGEQKSSSTKLSSTMFDDDHGNLWIGTNTGVCCMDLKTNKFIDILPKSKFAEQLSHTHITSIKTDENGTIYIGTHYLGLFIFDPATNKIHNINTDKGLSSNAIRSLMNDNEGNLWIGGEVGINILNLKSWSIHSIKFDPNDRSNINDNAIYAMHKDNNDNIWVGTYFGGANIYLRDYNNFTYYPYGTSNHHLSGKAVREIIGNDNNSIWIATEDGGLNLLDLRKNEFEHFNEFTKKIRLSYHNVHSLLKDHRSNLWIGTFTGGVNRYNLSSGQMNYYTVDNTGVQLNITFSIVEDSKHDLIWIAGTDGLSCYSYKTNTFTEIINPLFRKKHIYTMMLDSDDILWLGMRNFGVITYDHKSGQAYKVDTGSDFQSFVTCIHQDENKNVWIGTNDGGVTMFDKQNLDQKRYTVDDGLPSNSIMSIISDNSQCIWISTIEGLCCINPMNNTMVNYTTDNGLPTNQFNYISSYKKDDGKLFFGTINGLVSFYPDKITERDKKLNVAITGLSIGDTPVKIGHDLPLKENITYTQDITLTSKQAKLFSMDFTAFNFSNTNVMYAISIDKSSWQTIGNQHQITFSNLSIGKHQISLKASLDGNNWDDSGACSINVHILPPFYLSWFAFIIYSIIIASIIFMIFRIIKIRLKYVNSIKMERLEKSHMQELNRHKISFFTNISHELKTPLTLILSPLKMLTRDNNMPEQFREKLLVVTKNAQRMQNMIDELINFSKIEMKQAKISVCSGVILPFIDEMCQIFKIVAVEKDLNLVIDVDRNDRTHVWFSPSIIEKIIYNLLSNALKFTPANGVIVVHASIKESKNGKQTLHIEVNDTGIGIPEEAIKKIFENYYQVNVSDPNKGSGIGLAFTKSMVKMHRGTISVSSIYGEKSSFVVDIDVTQSSFSAEEQVDTPLNIESIQDYNYAIPTSEKFETHLLAHDEESDDEKPKILIVEDNMELNSFIADIFKSKYTVFSAYDGKHGHELTRQIIPDIIISDVMMPQMSGYELTNMVKSELLTCHIPIILLTAKTSIDDQTEGFEYGADVYITKPFDAHNLELQIFNILQTKRNNIKRFKNFTGIEVSKITTNPRDEKFMTEIINMVKENLDNEFFSVNDITTQMGISRSMLYIKLKNLAGVSATELIRNIRLEESKSKLLKGYNVSEAAYAVGISDPNYFTKCFKKQFGATPTEYIRNLQSATDKAN